MQALSMIVDRYLDGLGAYEEGNVDQENSVDEARDDFEAAIPAQSTK
jgi:hypothetical protein